MKWLCTVGVAVSLVLQPALVDELFGNHSLTPQARNALVTDLLKKTMVDEKIGQLRLIGIGPDNPKEAIREMTKNGRVGAIFNTVTRPDIHVVQDQVMQFSRPKIPLFFAYDVLRGQHTVFPISLSLASSFNLDTVKIVGRVPAYEVADDGLNMTWAPMVDVSRDPRWGHASEGFGEDMYLTTMMGQAMVKSMQGKSPVDRYSAMTSVKHLAAYNVVEGGREYNTVDMSLQRLFNNYIPSHKAGLDVGSGAVMVTLNSLNGIPTTADSWLLRDVLYDQWGFKGITVPDHGVIKELIKHGVTSDPEDAVRMALKFGINMSMSDEYYSKYLPGLVKSGKMTMVELDDATHHVLNVEHDMGLLNDPYSHLGPKDSDLQDTNTESRPHREEAWKVARESLVLLKNRFDTLPLRKSGTIAVVGALVDSKRDMMGSWSAAGVADQSATVLTGIKEALGDNGRVTYAKGANVTDDKGIVDFLDLYKKAVQVDSHSPQEVIDEVITTAKQSDVAVTAADEAQGTAHEAPSRTDITLSQSRRNLIATLKATGKPLVLALMNGCPLALVKEGQQANVLLEIRFVGTEDGHAIANVLLGDYNLLGKLPTSFPRSVGQIPTCYSHLNTDRPYNPEKPNKYTSRYLDEVNGLLYPFGYGLNYTTFSISDVTMLSATLPRDDSVTASMQVINTGKREGTTVIQLYLQDVTAPMSRPVKMLRGFKKANLKPGEAQTVNFPTGVNALELWNQQVKHIAEPGKFSAFIGMDSARVKQSEFELL